MQDLCYGIDLIEELLEDMILALEALKDILCPHCHTQTVHRVFRDNPDGSYDDVGLKCKKCMKML